MIQLLILRNLLGWFLAIFKFSTFPILRSHYKIYKKACPIKMQNFISTINFRENRKTIKIYFGDSLLDILSSLYKSNRICVCLFVFLYWKILLTDMVLLYNVASHRYWESLTLLWRRKPPPSQEIWPKEKIIWK